MMTISAYRRKENCSIPEIQHKSVSYRIRSRDRIDDNVFLQSYNCNLQRGYVWSLEQNRSLIKSILLERNIPNITIIHCLDDSFKIIDGKQRLNAYLSFLEDKFSIIINGCSFLFSDLPDDFKSTIKFYPFKCDAYVEIYESDKLSDESILNWFEYLNFAGTQIDIDHINKIRANKS